MTTQATTAETTQETMQGFSYARLQQEHAAATAALGQFGKAIKDSGLSPQLTELVKVRASQKNGCAFCLQFHVNLARSLNVPQAQLDQLATWQESPLFSAAEKAALAWAEALTSTPALPDPALMPRLREHFSEADCVNLTLAIAHINAWNRIAGPLGFTPPPAQ